MVGCRTKIKRGTADHSTPGGLLSIAMSRCIVGQGLIWHPASEFGEEPELLLADGFLKHFCSTKRPTFLSA
jgi:hypothetical protein